MTHPEILQGKTGAIYGSRDNHSRPRENYSMHGLELQLLIKVTRPVPCMKPRLHISTGHNVCDTIRSTQVHVTDLAE